MTRRRLGRWWQGAVVLGVGILGFGVLFVVRDRLEQIDPPRVLPVVATASARTTSGAILVRGGGTVRPSAEVAIAAEVGGRVAWVSPAFVSGGWIVRGEELVRVDPTAYENAVAVAQAEVEQEQVNLLEAEAEAEMAAEEWRRLAVRNGLDLEPPNALVARRPQLEAASAALRRAEARLADARMAMEQTSVRAPFNGIFREESANPGQIVVPGEPLGWIYSANDVEVVVRLSYEDAALVDRLWEARPGYTDTRIPAEVKVEYAGAVYGWSGFVHRAEAALHDRTRMVTVVVRVPRPFEIERDQPGRPPLLVGGYATVDIQGRSFDRYAVIPVDALREGDVVWAVREDSLLAITPVTRIQEVEDVVTVLGPIEDGDLVIVSALPFVTDGMTVRVGTDPGRPGASPSAGPMGRR